MSANSPSTPSPQVLFSATQKLIEQQATVNIATVNEQGLPDASYAPFVHIKPRFYIFVSELARHTQNILRNPRVSLFFAEAEATSKNLFARERLVLQCEACDIQREDDEFSKAINTLKAEFGDMIALLESLPDFHLLRLSPSQGAYTVGFGKAYNLTVDAAGQYSFQHLDEQQLKGR